MLLLNIFIILHQCSFCQGALRSSPNPSIVVRGEVSDQAERYMQKLKSAWHFTPKVPGKEPIQRQFSLMRNTYAVNSTISQQLKADLCLFISYTISQAHSILCTPAECNLSGTFMCQRPGSTLVLWIQPLCMPDQSCVMQSSIFQSQIAYCLSLPSAPIQTNHEH